MKKNLITSVLMTLVTTVLFGLLFPLLITGLAQVLFPSKANGELLTRNGALVGSRADRAVNFPRRDIFTRARRARELAMMRAIPADRILDQPIKLSSRECREMRTACRRRIPGGDSDGLADVVGFGLDPHISPEAAEFQVPRIAKERGLSEDVVREAVRQHAESRQFGFLGEPRVNVLELNLTWMRSRRSRAGWAGLAN
jgi:potassium-transporting ATPase KdpC subunit